MMMDQTRSKRLYLLGCPSPPREEVRILPGGGVAPIAPTRSASSGAIRSRAFAELQIDCQEDRTLWAVLVGMLREADR